MTTRRERGASTRLLVALVMGLVALTGVGCGSDADVHEFVVPLGTAERLAAGEDVVVMPSPVEFRVGDTIRIRNEDVVDQSVGPYQVAAGSEFELTFGAPGRYQGYCPLSEGDSYEIIVTE